MAEFFVPHVSQIRPALDGQAPWSSVAKKALPAKGRIRSVVYVVEQIDGPMRKLGRTTQLKRRVSEISQDLGSPVAIAFWAEFCQADARQVEQLAIRFVGDCVTSARGREWFEADSRFLAESILLASKHLGIRHIAQAGAPDGFDHHVSDEQAMIFEEGEKLTANMKAGPVNWGS